MENIQSYAGNELIDFVRSHRWRITKVHVFGEYFDVECEINRAIVNFTMKVNKNDDNPGKAVSPLQVLPASKTNGD